MPYRLLHVEDNAIERQIIRDNLTHFGFIVDSCCSISSAEDYLAKNNYDCVIIDVSLPPSGLFMGTDGMLSGIHYANILLSRFSIEGKKTKIFIYTAYSFETIMLFSPELKFGYAQKGECEDLKDLAERIKYHIKH